MIHIYGSYRDDDGKLRSEMAGKLTADGEIVDIENEEHKTTLQRCADELKQLTVEELLGLYTGPRCFAVDMRERDELSEAERERLFQRSVRKHLHDIAQGGEIVKTEKGSRDVSKDELFRVLESHTNPYPMDKLMKVLNDHWSMDALAEMHKQCDSDKDTRLFVARQDDVAKVVKSVQARLE